MKKVNSVEEYIETHKTWREALLLLRALIISTELVETLKWNAPVYTLNTKNVIGLGAFKNHFGIWFFNGVFLKDKNKLLTNAQEGKTKALRQMKFSSIKDINKTYVLDYVNEAIENHKAGKEIKADRTKKDTIIPNELYVVLNSNDALNTCFKALTPYKQRAYCEFIASAKRVSTKLSRLDKIKPMILRGIGLNDKYKTC